MFFLLMFFTLSAAHRLWTTSDSESEDSYLERKRRSFQKHNSTPPSCRFSHLQYHVMLLQLKKISRDYFVRKLRLIVGANLMKSAIYNNIHFQILIFLSRSLVWLWSTIHFDLLLSLYVSSKSFEVAITYVMLKLNLCIVKSYEVSLAIWLYLLMFNWLFADSTKWRIKQLKHLARVRLSNEEADIFQLKLIIINMKLWHCLLLGYFFKISF